jgi:L-erythro-3,5-diaminohexanoate dehydrogenase
MAADVTMLIGNGYVPGHADLALGLIRDHPGVRSLFEARIAEHHAHEPQGAAEGGRS